jgi:hypothetical protein
VTVGREADKVKPNGKKRMNLRAAELRRGACRSSVPGQGQRGQAGICVMLRSPRIAVAECEMTLDTDIV